MWKSLAVLLPALLALQTAVAALAPVDLRCDGLANPLGVDAAPRFSWQLSAPAGVRGARQTAWQLRVGDWDSGRVESAAQLNIPYAGPPLYSHQPVSWQVRVWDEANRASDWSAPQSFTVGVLTPDDWAPARWITDAASLADDAAAIRANATLLLRREFTVRPGLRRALLHVSGLGQYRLDVNGRAPDQTLLTPGWTAYEKTVLYETRELTGFLQPGANTLGLTLASGMYSVQPGRYTKFTSPFRPLKAVALLRLEYTDGSVETVVTDPSWRVTTSPTTFSNVFGGEDYDARIQPADWQPAVVTDGPGGELRGASHASPAFRAFETLTPVAIHTIRPGVTVYDLGQNASLMLHLRATGAAGARVKIIPAELVNADGSVDRRSAGGGEASWNYTFRGATGGPEEWSPEFFYHGSRYLQVELVSAWEDGPLPVINTIEGRVVHSDSPPAGEFECSSDLFNRIRTLIRWAQRSNLAHVITDCPHRERLGWLEQYHLNGPALRYEWDLTQLYGKCFDDMADAQTPDGLIPDIAPEYVVFSGGFRDSPEWGSALILAARQHYTWTGDDTPLRRHYDAMRRYLAYLDGKATGHLLNHGLGDWYDIGPGRPGRSQLTPVSLTATAIYYEDTVALAGIARHLGQEADARNLTAHAADIRSAFNAKFLDPDKGVYATGSQTSHALPLVLDLVPEENRAAVFAGLVRDVQDRGNAITAGDVGYRYLLRALAEGGRSDVIYAMNAQSDKPGYGYQLAHGATSLTEAWNAEARSSQNHFMLGQIMEWFYHDLAGLAPDLSAPGFARVLIAPQPVDGIDWARAAHNSPRGRVAVAWRKAAGLFTLTVNLPPNTTAEVSLPAADVREGDRPAREAPGVKFLRQDGTRAIFAVESGHYEFSTPAATP